MKFTCLICKEKFDNVLSLRKHMKDHLNDSKWVWGFNPSFSIGFWNQPMYRKKYHDFSLVKNIVWN